MRARTDSSWRWPALFALITGTVGTVNATALIMSGLGVVVWMIADALSRVTTWRDTLRFAWRSGVLCLGVSVWWINGLLIQGKFGLPILRYTETYETVAKASSVQEIVRGLGYWFFYGGDKLGRWVGPSASYLTNPLVLVIGWSVAGLGLLCIMTINHRYRVHLALLLLFGLAVAVGAAPIGGPSVYGRFFASRTQRIRFCAALNPASRTNSHLGSSPWNCIWIRPIENCLCEAFCAHVCHCTLRHSNTLPC